MFRLSIVSGVIGSTEVIQILQLSEARLLSVVVQSDSKASKVISEMTQLSMESDSTSATI